MDHKRLSLVTFRCPSCKHTFKAEPGRVDEIDTGDDEKAHPYLYASDCPKCGTESGQAAWERAALKAWRCSTGPKTEEGKAAVRENLKGHPTPEEALRTRFNGMKHGLNARVASYFPAKPGGYAFCQSCDVDRIWCSQQPCCEKQTVHFMKHHAAFEQKNPKHLMGIYADFHAALMATIGECLRRIIGDGVTISAPKTYIGKNGKCMVVDWLDEYGERHIVWDVNAHPLFKPVSELITRTGISLSDLGMTPKVMDDDEEALGRLKEEGDRRETLEAFARQNAESLSALKDMVARAQEKKGSDPALLEYREQNG